MKQKIGAVAVIVALVLGIVVTIVRTYRHDVALKKQTENPSKKNPYPQPSQKVYQIGDIVDTFNGVNVYYNGSILNVSGRNRAADGYNLGLKYQCVEFVKRYYYQYLKHKMPETMGNAKDFFNKNIDNGGYNAARDLYQYKNNGNFAPEPNDLVVWDGNPANPYGHVAIVAKLYDDEVEIVQQNPGSTSSSRIKLPLIHYQGKWKVAGFGILGWLRKR